MIVIPMAGLSSRFFKAGYDIPKYMLPLGGKTVFAHAVESFQQYFDSERFVFIVRDVYDTPAFVEKQCRLLSIKDFEVITLDEETRGQAETVAKGIELASPYQGALTIFNIDTFRPGFEFPTKEKLEGGYLEVFKGSGSNWSFVKPQSPNSTRAIETAEKRAISDLCCTGLYHFGDISDYWAAYNHYLALPQEQWEKGELYVAPLYNHLIEKGHHVHYHLIDRAEVIFCGVPDEYQALLDQQ
ncbi:glycosyltransferase family 2 protein [Vibrio sp. SCSIO 43136]|uniref:glycosyltransferase family 2 protein n=1 Tax=Vibrio sp. SCSIO 43136 TaxID=2819101 RepID=UPI0020751E33|nr:glycosyltransferase family 2 protein [Vibrio sp. SCSIO 43136]USD65156.1 glycosyltransferase family 2 protein [Vibrio sp. SCSIO 43136]